MSLKKMLVAVALLSFAASAQAGWIPAIPESATVTLVFASLALIAFAFRREQRDDVQPSTES